jgi:hypothetical protein
MVALSLLILAAVSCGQADPATRKADDRLADALVDGSYGFSIRPPKGWQVIRQRSPERRGVVLLRMMNRTARNRTEELTLKQTSTMRDVPMGEMLEKLHHALELEFSSVEVLSRQEQEITGRQGGLLATRFWRDGFRWLRLQAIIRLRPQSYYILLYNGPAEGRERSEVLFHLVLASLRLLEDRFTRPELEAALSAGQQWISSLGAEALTEAIVPERFVKFEVGGEAVGFVRIREAQGKSKDRLGVRIQERGWLYESGGRVRRRQSNMFIRDDLQAEKWKTSVTTLVPSAGSRSAYLEIALEEGLREDDVLLTSQVYGWAQPTVQNPSLTVPQAYLPRGLAGMLPRLVGDLSTPRRLAFVEFDHRRAEMSIHVVEMKGVGELPDGGTGREVYLIEHYEGPAAEPSSLYVDEAGHLLLMKAGDLVGRPAKAEKLERLFAGRVSAAEREMARLEREYEEAERRFAPKRPAPGPPH